ncbi:TPA: Nif3-like dinuclear metal center hexameric protein [Staphylococcus aureus]
MKIADLMTLLDHHVPFSTAESWDNVGLLIGDGDVEVTGVLTALDCTLEVVNEAIEKGYNTIISHHPLIFKGVTSLKANGYGLIIRKLIQYDINLIAMHTNLDVNPYGVNMMLAKAMGLKNISIINNQQDVYYKVQTYIPKDNVGPFKDKLSENGLAQEGNYEYCFFESEGRGQFKPVGEANPTIGQIDKIEDVDEVKIEFMIDAYQKSRAEQLIKQYHPYETPVFDFIEIKQTSLYGLGVMAEVDNQMTLEDFAADIKSKLNIPSVRFVGESNQKIKRIAIIGGSGIGYEYQAVQQGADVFVTGDIKHHDALDAKIHGVNLIDINHYSEYVMKEGLKTLLMNWFNIEKINIDVEASTINTDPFQYI